MRDEYLLKVEYTKDNRLFKRTKTLSSTGDDGQTEDFLPAFKISVSRSGGMKRLTIYADPEENIRLKQCEIIVKHSFTERERLFLNGFQSWTDSYEHAITDKQKGLPLPGRLVNPLYRLKRYGDYNFVKQPRKAGYFHGFTYAYIRTQGIPGISLMASLNIDNCFTLIRFSVPDNEIRISADCDGLLLKEKMNILDIVFIDDDEDAAFDLWFSMMGVKKPGALPSTGWTSWYNHYEDINEQKINHNLEAFTEKKLPADIFQIDDGFQTATGDWLSIDKKKFPEGLTPLVEKIHAAGMKAGLWLAPFAASKKAELVKQHPEWILRDSRGEMVTAGMNWGGFYALDIFNDEFRDYLRVVFDSVLKIWNFDIVKLDFLYAACLAPPEGKSRGRVMREGMKFLRALCGEKLILGCGVPLASAFGMVDYCRIGCDVTLDWDEGFLGSLIHRERPSTLNSIRNAIGRRHLDGRAFLNDPDVFILRSKNTKLTQNEKETLFRMNALTGSLLFTSDDVSDYGKIQCGMFSSLKENKTITGVEEDGALYIIRYKSEGDEKRLIINISDSSLNYGGKILSAHESFIV